MTDPQYRAFMDLLMCSDPWPIDGVSGDRAYAILDNLANAEAKSRGFDNWITAYHKMEMPDGPQV